MTDVRHASDTTVMARSTVGISHWGGRGAARPDPATASAAALGHDAVFELQRSVGNAATRGLLCLHRSPVDVRPLERSGETAPPIVPIGPERDDPSAVDETAQPAQEETAGLGGTKGETPDTATKAPAARNGERRETKEVPEGGAKAPVASQTESAPGGMAASAGAAIGGASMRAFEQRAAAGGRTLATTPSVRSQVAATQGAAAGPANEQLAGGKAAQIGDMESAPDGGFDRDAFIAAVEKALADQAPRKLEEATNLTKSGRMAKVKDALGGQAGDRSGTAKGPVEAATKAGPDTSRGQKKAVTPMRPMPKVARPPSPGAAKAMPQTRPPEETDLSAEPDEVTENMDAAGITDEQLASSEEPQFLDALASKREGERHSKEAPGPVRAAETAVLGKARGDAQQVEKGGLAGMIGARRASDAVVQSEKATAKGKDEKVRQKVSNRIEEIYSRTQAGAQKILDGVDGLVDAEFSRGERLARTQFEQQHKREMDAWKDRRYSGLRGKGRWLKDKFLDPPPEANRIFDRARSVYLTQMRKVIGRVADVVVRELAAAKKRIADGRREIADYVATLPRELRSVGAELAEQTQTRFDSLDSDVDAKQGDMVSAVVGKYRDAKSAIDEKVAALKAANRGLWGRAKAAIGAVIDTIKNLKDQLASAFKGAGSAVMKILASPSRFFGNLMASVKQGLDQFVARISTHLRRGLLKWLTGSLGPAGVTLPDKLDLRGIIGLVLQIIGLTWANVRGRIVKKLGPRADRVIAGVESGFALVGQMMTEGPVVLWKLISSKVTNLWDLVVGKIEEYLVEKVIKAGVTWLIGLLNPVAGFIKICKAIVDLVMWFWNNAGKIIELVKAIAGSAMAIARGAIGQAANAVEGVLGRLVPLAIGFLASLLGLGGISGQVKSIIATVRRPINRVVDGVVGKAVSFGRRLLRSAPGKKLAGKVRSTIRAGKKTVERAKAWGEKRVQSAKKRIYGGDDSSEGKSRRLQLAVTSAVRSVNTYAGRYVPRALLEPKLGLIRARRGIGHLAVKPIGEVWAVEGRIDRQTETTNAKAQEDAGAPVAEEPAQERNPLGHAQRADGTLIVGKRAPYGQNAEQDPLKDSHSAALGLVAEHIIPRQAVARLVRSLGGPGAPRTGAFDNEMMTIKIYDGAATLKTASDGAIDGDVASADKIVEVVFSDRTIPSNAGRYRVAAEKIGAVVVPKIQKNRTDATFEAVRSEAADRGQQRQTTGVLPSLVAIGVAAVRQARQVREHLEFVAETINYRSDVDDPGFELAQQLARDLGGTMPSADGEYRVRVGLGAAGGMSSRGTATITISGGSWSVRVGKIGRLDEATRGSVHSGQIGEGDHDQIVSLISALRRGDHDGPQGQSSRSTPEERQQATDRMRVLVDGGRTRSDAAKKVSDELHSAASGEGFVPAPSTIADWYRARFGLVAASTE